MSCRYICWNLSFVFLENSAGKDALQLEQTSSYSLARTKKAACFGARGPKWPAPAAQWNLMETLTCYGMNPHDTKNLKALHGFASFMIPVSPSWHFLLLCSVPVYRKCTPPPNDTAIQLKFTSPQTVEEPHCARYWKQASWQVCNKIIRLGCLLVARISRQMRRVAAVSNETVTWINIFPEIDQSNRCEMSTDRNTHPTQGIQTINKNEIMCLFLLQPHFRETFVPSHTLKKVSQAAIFVILLILDLWLTVCESVKDNKTVDKTFAIRVKHYSSLKYIIAFDTALTVSVII